MQYRRCTADAERPPPASATHDHALVPCSHLGHLLSREEYAQGAACVEVMRRRAHPVNEEGPDALGDVKGLVDVDEAVCVCAGTATTPHRAASQGEGDVFDFMHEAAEAPLDAGSGWVWTHTSKCRVPVIGHHPAQAAATWVPRGLGAGDMICQVVSGTASRLTQPVALTCVCSCHVVGALVLVQSRYHDARVCS